MGGPTAKEPGTHAGTRNDTLFRQLLREARAVDDLDALLDVARTLNAAFEPPLSDAEVVRTARSAWSYESDPDKGNWVGREQIIAVTRSDLGALAANPDALVLYLMLKATRGGDTAPRPISAKAMARNEVIPGWPDARRHVRAREWLIARGALQRPHIGGKGRGDPSLYVLRLVPIAKGA